MPLTDNEKSALAGEFHLIGEMGEPEALIAVLRDACARKADDRQLTRTEASRWRLAANALMEAEATVTAAQSPEARKLAEHAKQWSGDAPKARYVDLEGNMKADIAASQRNQIVQT